ncbi:hypothetical protein J2S43_003684 [Catenuloplanes nepalensis]|uniref:Uncharacterized protein n=1 Tax=Catenuloplanes nepalensis TaxID=587533 RepID=A0ABT9MUP1_9ACTN|nr:hypothetical protein [Catenuloplanes nepalensis]MDP9795172.1 hypothetical protein [Catenuloplanes nepalensis]
MSDPLRESIGTLRGTAPPRPFAGAAEVRRRGVRRGRRQALTAALVLLLAVAGVQLVRPQAPLFLVIGAQSIHGGMFLSAAELGHGLAPASGISPAVTWLWARPCRFFDPDDYPSLEAVTERDFRVHSADGGVLVFQAVMRFSSADEAARNLRDVRTLAVSCGANSREFSHNTTGYPYVMSRFGEPSAGVLVSVQRADLVWTMETPPTWTDAELHAARDSAHERIR